MAKAKTSQFHTAVPGATGAARSSLMWVFIVVGALLVAGALTAPSLSDRLGLQFSSASQAPAKAVVDRAGGPGGAASRPLDVEDLRRVVALLSESERAKLTGDQAAFAQLVQREAARHALIRAARNAGLEQRSEVVLMMQRNSEQVLVDTFLKLGAGAAVSGDFPSDAEVKAFYQSNRDRYRLEERIPVWQVFLSAPENADTVAMSEAEKLANATAKALRSGKLSFAEAAARHSDHQASAVNGGFMGNLRVSELIPEIKDVVVAAEPGDISGPIRSAAGFHLLKRGERIEAHTLPLEKVAPQIRASLRQTAEANARQQLALQAQRQFGVALSQEELERWRQALIPGGVAARSAD